MCALGMVFTGTLGVLSLGWALLGCAALWCLWQHPATHCQVRAAVHPAALNARSGGCTGPGGLQLMTGLRM